VVTLARIYDFTRQKLQTRHPNEELENFLGHMNAFVVGNPLLSDLDFGGFVAKKFGLKKGWGVVDASKFTSLQNAIDSIDQGLVLVPPVEYLIGAEPVILDRDDLWLVGYGAATVLKKDRIYLPRSADSFDSSARGNPAVWIKKASRCRVMNLTIDMNDTQGVDIDPFPTAALDARRSPDTVLANVTVKNFGDRSTQQEPRGTASATFAAVDVRDSDRARVLGCHFSKVRSAAIWCGGALDAQGETRGRQIISANEISDADVGIQIVPSNNINVSHNQLYRVAGSGITAVDTATTTRVRSSNIEIIGNQLREVGINAEGDIAAIEFRVMNPRVNNLRVSDNQIHHVRGNPNAIAYGIRIEPLTSGSDFSFLDSLLVNIEIDSNILVDIYDHGIWVAYDSGSDKTAIVDALSISGNMVTRCSQGPERRRGISIMGRSLYNPSTGEGAIRAFRRSSILDNTVVESSVEYGIYFENGDAFTSFDTKYVYGTGSGGIVDGNIVVVDATLNPIFLGGDLTIAVGDNVATNVKLTNDISQAVRDL
jgi:hypothetical protein